MKKILFSIIATAALFCGCTESGGDSATLTADFTISENPCFAGETITFTNKSTGGKQPYTCEWSIGSETTLSGSSATYVFNSNGTFVVTLSVTDANGNKAERRKNLVVNPAQVDETGEITLNWVGRMEGYNSITVPAVDNDGNIYSACRDNNLYKFSSTGDLLWKKAIFTPGDSSSAMWGNMSIDTDGTVYVGGGSAGADGVFVAFNPDGTEKWRFKDFFTTGDLKPTVWAIVPGIGDENIYVGNTGTTGSVISINKATGERNGYCRHGNSGPTGGARTGIVISKEGTLHWYGGIYGLFGMSQTTLDNGTDGADYLWSTYSSSGASDYAQLAPLAGLAAITVNGKACICGMATDLLSTKIYTVECATGKEVSAIRIYDTDDQDQGGVVATADGHLVGSLNYTLGQANGGIVIGDPATGEVISRYTVQEKVSGSPAVDAAGNIHFGTESGYYYIVKPEGDNCKLLLKRNVADMIKADSRYADSFSELYAAKIWCSPTIADDGTIYICFTDDDTRAFGGLLSMKYEGCTGPADSEWPMFGHDRRHTNRQQ